MKMPISVSKTFQRKYTNPVVNSNHPDPGVMALPNEQGFILVSTSDLARPNSTDPVFPILFSFVLVNWELVSFAES